MLAGLRGHIGEPESGGKAMTEEDEAGLQRQFAITTMVAGGTR